MRDGNFLAHRILPSHDVSRLHAWSFSAIMAFSNPQVKNKICIVYHNDHVVLFRSLFNPGSYSVDRHIANGNRPMLVNWTGVQFPSEMQTLQVDVAQYHGCAYRLFLVMKSTNVAMVIVTGVDDCYWIVMSETNRLRSGIVLTRVHGLVPHPHPLPTPIFHPHSPPPVSVCLWQMTGLSDGSLLTEQPGAPRTRNGPFQPQRS